MTAYLKFGNVVSSSVCVAYIVCIWIVTICYLASTGKKGICNWSRWIRFSTFSSFFFPLLLLKHFIIQQKVCGIVTLNSHEYIPQLQGKRESKENTFWFSTTVLGFKLHKRFFMLFSSKETMQPVGKDTVLHWWKEYIRLWDPLVLNRKLLGRKTVWNGSYITLMCTPVDMLSKLWQVQTLPHAVWPQKIIVTRTWSLKWLLTLSTYSHQVIITEITSQLWLRISVGILRRHWRQ